MLVGLIAAVVPVVPSANLQIRTSCSSPVGLSGRRAAAGAVACAPDSLFDAAAWQRTDWAPLMPFERSALLRALLDGDLTVCEANHAAWRGLGFALAPDGVLLDPEGAPCATGPDVLSDETWLARLRAELPPPEDGSLEEEEEAAMLDTLVESLHGEDLTRALVEAGDAEFGARRTLVQWLYTTQPGVALR